MNANYVAPIVTRLEQNGIDPDPANLYALLVLTKGVNTTLANVHDAWALWRQRTNPNHPALIPFEDLVEDVQELDRPYMELIHKIAGETFNK